jgi:hypothetical protein
MTDILGTRQIQQFVQRHPGYAYDSVLLLIYIDRHAINFYGRRHLLKSKLFFMQAGISASALWDRDLLHSRVPPTGHPDEMARHLCAPPNSEFAEKHR